MKAPHSVRDTACWLGEDSSSPSSLVVNWARTWAAKVLYRKREAANEAGTSKRHRGETYGREGAASKKGSTTNILESPALLDIEVLWEKTGKILECCKIVNVMLWRHRYGHAASPLTADANDISLTQEERQSSVSARNVGQDVGDESQRHGRGFYCSLKRKSAIAAWLDEQEPWMGSVSLQLWNSQPGYRRLQISLIPDQHRSKDFDDCAHHLTTCRSWGLAGRRSVKRRLKKQTK